MRRLAILSIALFSLRCGVQPSEVLSGEDRSKYLQEIGIEKILLTDGKEDGKHLYVLDNRSSQARRLTTAPASRFGSWSPDGRRIAYIERDVNAFDNNSLNVMKEDGTDVRRLVNYPAGPIILFFKWSPDGSVLAFRVGPQTGALSGAVYTMRADGTGLATIEAPWAPTSGQNVSFNLPGEVAWSPDGRTLAYEAKYNEDAVPQIYLIKADGTGRRRLTNTATAARDPSWSPDGRKIVFDADARAYLIHADGTDQRQISTSSTIAPVWSPTGDAVIYRTLNSSLGIMSSDGAGRRLLISLNTGESALFKSWSPDGSRIAFVGSSGGRLSMYVIKTTGNDLRSIVDDVGSFDVKWAK